MDNKDSLLLNEKITTILNNIHVFKKIRSSLAETGMIHYLEVKSFCQREKVHFYRQRLHMFFGGPKGPFVHFL